MQSFPQMMRRLGPQLFAGNNRGKQAPGGAAPGWAELRLLLEHWAEIVDSSYVELTTPQTVKFKSQDRRDGTLVIAAPGALRTELQHDAQLIIGRVNRLFGYAAIAHLQLVPQTTALDMPPAVPSHPVDPALLADIADANLRDALQNLGAVLPRRLY